VAPAGRANPGLLHVLSNNSRPAERLSCRSCSQVHHPSADIRRDARLTAAGTAGTAAAAGGRPRACGCPASRWPDSRTTDAGPARRSAEQRSAGRCARCAGAQPCAACPAWRQPAGGAARARDPRAAARSQHRRGSHGAADGGRQPGRRAARVSLSPRLSALPAQPRRSRAAQPCRRRRAGWRRSGARPAGFLAQPAQRQEPLKPLLP
jgi:hypothetical protein